MGKDLTTVADARPPRRGRGAAVAVSVACHGVLVAAVMLAPRPVAPTPPAEPVFAVLAPPPPPPRERQPAPAPAAATHVAAPLPAPAAPPVKARATTAPAPALAAIKAPALGSGAGDALGEGRLAGATTAGSGRTRGECDMPLRLQTALRKDALVRAALSGRGAGATLVWDGDWTASAGEEGRGLAAVREAVIWEVGFAPKACREEPVSGLVLLSLADGPGAPRLALGGGAWRWTDLLHPRRQ